MSIKEIQQAIECWASRPTWFSSHPSDTKELRKAISNLQILSDVPSKEELTQAIYDRVRSLPAMLGTPKNIDQAVQEFSAKIHAKL